ncbi:HdeD family acid-resistance protein [Vagococcus lutrae]|uniref:HdeD family acid-resistance protein n=1 Tax=Vagococcus lutrae TaxID=81947 RepID=UPI0023A981F3|nr:DUF308 domain-containing protein [Vagococcus lutrae]WEB81334.1 DUF308 domain-containing protein [Vagococcus lutrae]
MSERKIDWMSILVGILFILAAMASFRQPALVLTTLVMWLALIAVIKGIQHFVTYNRIKSNFGGASTLLVVNGVLDVLFGAIVLFNVKAKFISMLLLGWLFALWFISSSLVRIFSARLLRPFSKLAYWTTMILNILCVIAGITMFFNPLGASLTVPFLIGFYFLMFGIERIISGFTATGI